MASEYKRILVRQHKIWTIAGLMLPSLSSIIMILLMLFDFNSYLEIFAFTVSLIFLTAASYWWWWTMFQLYKFSKLIGDTEENIKSLGDEFRSIKDDIKNL